MSPEGAGPRPGPHLSVAAVLVAAAAAVLVWSGINSGASTYFGFAALLAAMSAGLFKRQLWAKYLVFAFAAASVLWWGVQGWYSWRQEGQTGLAMAASLLPGAIWCAFWLSLCQTVQRGFGSRARPG